MAKPLSRQILLRAMQDILAAFTTAIVTTGDIAAAGGFRMAVGPFAAPGAATVTAASQTDLACRYEHVAAFACEFIAFRAGSIMGLSAQIDTAVTGAGTSITVKVSKNGTALVAGPQVSLTQAGAEVKGQATVAKDAFTFVAGDRIGVMYTSTAITNTPKLIATVEVEC